MKSLSFLVLILGFVSLNASAKSCQIQDSDMLRVVENNIGGSIKLDREMILWNGIGFQGNHLVEMDDLDNLPVGTRVEIQERLSVDYEDGPVYRVSVTKGSLFSRKTQIGLLVFPCTNPMRGGDTG